MKSIWKFLRLACLALLPGQLRVSDRAGDNGGVLVLVHAVHLNAPSADGLTADKIDGLLPFIFDGTRPQIFAVQPLAPRVGEPTAAGYLRVERALLRGLLKALPGITRTTWKAGARFGGLTLALWQGAWECLIADVKPAAVIGIGLDVYVLKAAARRSVPCIEIQHGTLSPETVEQYWFHATNSQDQIPSLLLTWDDHAGHNAKNRGIPALTSGPAFVFEDQARTGGSVLRAQSERRPLTSFYPCEGVGNPRLLILTSWGRDGLCGVLDKEMARLVRELYTSLGPEFLQIRLHPVVVSDSRLIRKVSRCVKSAFPRVQILNPRSSRLLDNIRSVDLLISRPSAAVYEAAAMGKRVAILGSPLQGEFPSALDPYIVLLEEDVDRAMEQIRETARMAYLPPLYLPRMDPRILRKRVERLMTDGSSEIPPGLT